MDLPPTGILAEASRTLQRAKTPDGVLRTAVRAAARLGEAASATWWERRRGGVLHARATFGLRLPPESRSIRVDRRAWTGGSGDREQIVRLSPARAEHTAFLERIGASDGILIPARGSGGWTGVLSVHDGNFTAERIDLIVALCQHCALALDVVELRIGPRQVAQGHQRASAEIDLAVASALSVDELASAICRSAVDLLPPASSFVLLADDGGPMVLRGQHHSGTTRRDIPETALRQLAEHARGETAGASVWHAGRRRALPGSGDLIAHGIYSALGYVLTIRGDTVGALILLSPKRNAFTASRRQMLSAFAAQTSRAIENLQLIEGMQRRLLELADLTWVSTRISSVLDVEKIAATVAEAAAKALDAPRSALLLVDEHGDLKPVPGGQRGVSHQTTISLPANGNLAADALATSAPQTVSDAQREGLRDDALIQWLGARSVLCVPMVAQQGLRGVLAVGDGRARHFQSHMLALLSAYANQGALALQSALLYQDVVRHLNELSSLSEVSRTLASSLDLTSTLERVLDAASELLGAEVCSLMLVDPKTKELGIKAARGLQPDHVLYTPLKLGEGLAGLAAESKMPLVSADIRRDGRFKHRVSAREHSLRAAISAPLLARGRVVGVLNLYRRSAREFADDDRRLVMALADSAAVAIENARLYEEAQERAQFLSAMVGEINHRMRNTLEAVAGLLRMELKTPQSRTAEVSLRRGISRLQSVAVVHEMMRARDLQFVDVKRAAQRIVEITCQTTAPDVEVQTRVLGARVLLPSQQATNAALILSELVDNAIRHGVADARDGRISVAFSEGGDTVVMEVRDSGTGLPATFDLNRDAGLGLRLVRGLVEDELGGRLDVRNDGGLVIRAVLPRHA